MSSKPSQRKLNFLVVSLVSIAMIRLMCGSANVWQDRSGLQVAAKRFARSIRNETSKRGYPENEAIVYVFGEPALVFGLRGAGLPSVGPAQNLKFLTQPALRPTFVAFSSADSSLTSKDREELMSAKFERVDGHEPRKSHLVLNEKEQTFHEIEETKLFRRFN